MLRRTLALAALAAAPALIGFEAARSQEPIPFSLLRATNVARMRAEKINGGLTVYRPARCMYERGGVSAWWPATSKGSPSASWAALPAGSSSICPPAWRRRS
jgi:hypothetical protein